MPEFEIAQLNIAKLTYPIDAPEVSDFIDNLDRISARADNAKGFIFCIPYSTCRVHTSKKKSFSKMSI